MERKMKFIVLVHPANIKGYEAGQMPNEKLLANMGKFNEELVNAGVMLTGEGLLPSAKGARVHFPGNGKKTVTDGPFTEARELIGGFWMWQVKSKEEALEWAKRAPMEDGATLELRQCFDPSDFGPETEKRERSLHEKIEKQQNR
jgi:hypothetical protein